MKYINVLMAFTLCSVTAFAAPAIQFSCIGSEEYVSEPAGVKFTVNFEDWQVDVGYTSITAHFQESTYSSEAIDLLTFGKSSDCTGGKLTLPTLISGDSSVYKFSLDDGDCNGVPALVINAYCTKDY
jgi:hypothetical protein